MKGLSSVKEDGPLFFLLQAKLLRSGKSDQGRGVLRKFKPAVSRRTLLLTAALFWTAVGALLLFRGGWFLFMDQQYLVLAAGFVFGLVKGKMIFERTATKNITRIMDKQEGVCLGAVFSFKAWGLILLMIVMGRFLRTSDVSLLFYGFLVSAVGWGLLWSSRVFWLEWMSGRS